MILKFCFQNEIHRCSDPPVSFDSLRIFLLNTFKTSLPSQFDLYYVNSQGQKVFLNTEEDYQALKKSPTETIKIFIVEKEPKSEYIPPHLRQKKLGIDNNDYEVVLDSPDIKREIEISADEEEKALLVSPKKEQEALDDVFERLSDDMTKIHVIPQLQKVQNEPLQQEEIKKIVRDVLREQMPYIVAQVKETLVRENLSAMPNNVSTNTYYETQRIFPSQNSGSNYEQKIDFQPNPIRTETMPIQQEERPQPQGNSQTGVFNQTQERKPDFFDSMFSMLDSFSKKAVEALNDFSHNLDGDPNILCAEGKYPQSVVHKAYKLQEIFPEESKKNLLDFVQKYPKEMTLDQLTEQFVISKQGLN
jgi:hypothetical protein